MYVVYLHEELMRLRLTDVQKLVRDDLRWIRADASAVDIWESGWDDFGMYLGRSRWAC